MRSELFRYKKLIWINQFSPPSTAPPFPASTVSPPYAPGSNYIEEQKGYASLPILESYISDDVVLKIKSKYPSMFDITDEPCRKTTRGYLPSLL